MNEQNLKVATHEQAVIRGSKGGKASGEARRKKRDIKQKLKALLELPAADNDMEQLEALGVDPDDMDNEMVLVMAMFLSAAGGDVRAFDRIMQILGKDIGSQEMKLKRDTFNLKKKMLESSDKDTLEKLDSVLEKIEMPMLYYALTGEDPEPGAEEQTNKEQKAELIS